MAAKSQVAGSVVAGFPRLQKMAHINFHLGRSEGERTLYGIVIEKPDGCYEPAPNPPPPEWRERKGICTRCGEKVFVKSGQLRTFWTHGKGKTCVPKPNPVSAAISLVQYAKNKGALSEGDAEMRARYAAFSNASLNAETPESSPAPEPASAPAFVPTANEEEKELEDIFGKAVQRRLDGSVVVGSNSVQRRLDGSVVVGSNSRPAIASHNRISGEDLPSDTSRNNPGTPKSKAGWAPGEKEWWQRYLAEKRSRWRRG